MELSVRDTIDAEFTELGLSMVIKTSRYSLCKPLFSINLLLSVSFLISKSPLFKPIERNRKGGMKMQAYCVKCHTKKEMSNSRSIKTQNGKPARQGICPSCGTKMFRIAKS